MKSNKDIKGQDIRITIKDTEEQINKPNKQTKLFQGDYTSVCLIIASMIDAKTVTFTFL